MEWFIRILGAVIFTAAGFRMATGGAATSSRNIAPENARAVQVNLSSPLAIYQFEEDIAELRNMIKKSIKNPGEVSVADNKAALLRITTGLKKYLDDTYPGKNIPLTLLKIDSVIEMIEKQYEGTPGLDMEILRGKLYTVIQREIGSAGTIGERLQRLYERAEAATAKNQLIMTAMATLALVSEAGQYNTNVALSTTFAGPKTVGGKRRASNRRAKKLTRRGRRVYRR